MLSVLVNANIDESDAKAIVLDLILASESPKKSVDLIQLPRKNKVIKQQPEEEPTEEELEVEKRREFKSSQVRKVNVRTDFSAFGGNSEPLR
jgi:hypothetical protein